MTSGFESDSFSRIAIALPYAASAPAASPVLDSSEPRLLKPFASSSWKMVTVGLPSASLCRMASALS